jgi:hypothetical protein
LSLNIDADKIAGIAALGTALGGNVAFYRQAKENQELRRKDLVKEILLPLIKEFDKSEELRIAKVYQSRGILSWWLNARSLQTPSKMAPTTARAMPNKANPILDMRSNTELPTLLHCGGKLI